MYRTSTSGTVDTVCTSRYGDDGDGVTVGLSLFTAVFGLISCCFAIQYIAVVIPIMYLCHKNGGTVVMMVTGIVAVIAMIICIDIQHSEKWIRTMIFVDDYSPDIVRVAWYDDDDDAGTMVVRTARELRSISNIVHCCI